MLFFFFVFLVPTFATHKLACNNLNVNSWFLNDCEQKCVCEQLPSMDFVWKCHSQRESLTCMPADRRERYFETVKKISNVNHPVFAQLQSLLSRHETNFGAIHWSPQYFLPYHRIYIEEFEKLLQLEDCRVTVPWWFWPRYVTTWQNRAPFIASPQWLGTNSNPGNCVSDGAFASWTAPTHGCLVHNFGVGSMPTVTQVANVLAISSADFNGFSNSLENLHGVAHVRIGGTMANVYSPNHMAAFFAHHGYIDKLWHDWQMKSPAHFSAYVSAHDPNTPLNYAWGRSAGEVNDLFATGVEYVTSRASELGSGHFTFSQPSCRIDRFVTVPWLQFSFFSLFDIERVLMLNAGSDKLVQVPQFANAVLSEDDMRIMKANLPPDKEKIEAATRSMMFYNAKGRSSKNSRMIS